MIALLIVGASLTSQPFEAHTYIGEDGVPIYGLLVNGRLVAQVDLPKYRLEAQNRGYKVSGEVILECAGYWYVLPGEDSSRHLWKYEGPSEAEWKRQLEIQNYVPPNYDDEEQTSFPDDEDNEREED